MAKKKTIIIVAQGGLANRMRAIASSLYYAEKINRDLLVVWYKNKDLNAAFSDLFKTDQLPFKVIEPNCFNYLTFYEQPRKKNLFFSGIIRKITGCLTIKDVDAFFNAETIENLKGINKRMIINSGSQFADFGSEWLQRIFRFNDKVRIAAESILNGIWPDLSIQIRRTDNIESIKHSPLHYFEEIIVSEIDKNNEVKIFLATDDEKTKNYLYSKFTHNIIINPRKARRDTKEGMIDAAAEMFILSKCKIIYGSYWSSFSEIASLYGGNELIVVK